jgi:hypothetical protein
MRFSRMVLCIIVAVFIPATPVLSVNPYQSKASTVQTWMTVGASLSSLAIAGWSACSICPLQTPLANRLLVTIPVAGVGAAAGAVAGR